MAEKRPREHNGADGPQRASVLRELGELFVSSGGSSGGLRTAELSEGGHVRCAWPLTLVDLDPESQRTRGPPSGRLRFEWRCEICPPRGSPYGGRWYRLAVRVPVGYPQEPPRLQMLSIMLHAEVEMRDPYEGTFDDTFYDALESRALLAACPACPGGGSSAELPPEPTGAAGLRFGLGERVECKASGGWRAGSVVALRYREPSWPQGKTVPYQVLLDGGTCVYAPVDESRVIRRVRGSPAHPPSYSLRLLLDLLFASLCGPVSADPASVGAAVARVRAAAAAGPEVTPVWLEPPPPEAGEEEGEEGEAEGEAAMALSAADGEGEGEGGYGGVLWRRLASRHLRQVRYENKYRSLAKAPRLFDLEAGFRREWLAPSFAAALEAYEARGDTGPLRGMLDEVSPGVYTFEMLSLPCCDALLDEVDAYEASGMPAIRPNSMNNYGLVLNGPIGLERMMDSLQARYVAPLGELLFGSEGASLDHHHAFVVQYKAGQDLGLDMHTDACDVTLNVCLGRDFTGAGLTLCGLRGGEPPSRGGGDGRERALRHVHTHTRGHAILHLGRQRHGADDIVTGERYNLILWNKSSHHRLSEDFLAKYRSRPPAAPGGEAASGGEEAAPPDLACLSYTHDDDYENYKPYPPGKKPKPRGPGGG